MKMEMVPGEIPREMVRRNGSTTVVIRMDIKTWSLMLVDVVGRTIVMNSMGTRSNSLRSL